jgi:tRNA 2-thiouridine synthesizing protein A
MALQILDTKGLKCPQPTLKITTMMLKIPSGDILEVVADCPTFEQDVRAWCTRSKKVLLWYKEDRGVKKCQIQF